MHLHPAHRDAYRLARTLLAGVYAATPSAPRQEEPDAPLQRLRCAVVSATSLLLSLAVVGIGTAAVAADSATCERRLQDARTALDKVAETLAECHRHGHLAGAWYETLSDHQRRAAAALAAAPHRSAEA